MSVPRPPPGGGRGAAAPATCVLLVYEKPPICMSQFCPSLLLNVGKRDRKDKPRESRRVRDSGTSFWASADLPDVGDGDPALDPAGRLPVSLPQWCEADLQPPPSFTSGPQGAAGLMFSSCLSAGPDWISLEAAGPGSAPPSVSAGRMFSAALRSKDQPSPPVSVDSVGQTGTSVQEKQGGK